MNTSIALAAAFALLAGPALAQSVTQSVTQGDDGSAASTTRNDNSGTVPGASSGVVAGAVLAGPIGAVLGGIKGAAVGHSVAPPTEVRTYVTHQATAPTAYRDDVEVGKPINGSVTFQDVPNYPKYHWAHLNNERVVVDDSHNVVAVYTD